MIVKPADSPGGRGIALIESPDARDDVGRAFHRAIQFSRAGQVLIEEFVSGPEYSVEAITIGGHTRIVAVTDKVTTGPPYFVETGHSQPCQSSAVAVAVLCKLAVDAIDNSASHTEIRIGPNGPRVIEIGARLGAAIRFMTPQPDGSNPSLASKTH